MSGVVVVGFPGESPRGGKKKKNGVCATVLQTKRWNQVGLFPSLPFFLSSFLSFPWLREPSGSHASIFFYQILPTHCFYFYFYGVPRIWSATELVNISTSH